VDPIKSRRIDLTALYFSGPQSPSLRCGKKYAEKNGLILRGQICECLRSLGMLYTIAVILLVLWLAGWLGLNILGGFIHILVVLAIIAIVMAMLKKA